ncbi:hypothetical protein MMC15_003613 [Xylographa vitiligo]|nr:hypothetical protein [Xylographa vitiligo]
MVPFLDGRPFNGTPLFVLLCVLICGATSVVSTPAATPLASQDVLLPAPSDLQKRVPNSTPIDTCGDHHLGWSFQQSACQDFGPHGVRAWRMICYAPNALSMLQGPIHWSQLASIDGECLPTQLCVDGPYTPPKPWMMQLHDWYKHFGTAHCVEIGYLVGLGQAGLEVIMRQADQALIDRGEGVKKTGIYPPGAGIFA